MSVAVLKLCSRRAHGQRRSRLRWARSEKISSRRYGLPAQTRVALRAHRNEVVVRVQQGVGHATAYPSRNEAELAKGDGEGRNPVIWDGALVFDRILALMEVPLSTAEKRGLVRRRLRPGRLQTKEPRT
jgi:hypothetical protein